MRGAWFSRWAQDSTRASGGVAMAAKMIALGPGWTATRMTHQGREGVLVEGVHVVSAARPVIVGVFLDAEAMEALVKLFYGDPETEV